MANIMNWFKTLVEWEIYGNRSFSEYLLGVLTIFVVILLVKDVAARIEKRKAAKAGEIAEEVEVIKVDAENNEEVVEAEAEA